jgi:hypothetical protein
MALATTPQETTAALIVVGMCILTVLILLVILIQQRNRAQMYKRRADEMESMFKEAKHYEQEMKAANGRL